MPERTRSGEGLSSQGFRCLKGGGLSGKRGLRVSICVDASWEASRVTGTSRVTQVMMLLKIRDPVGMERKVSTQVYGEV